MENNKMINIIIRSVNNEEVATISIETNANFTIKEYIRSIRPLLRSVKKNTFKIALYNEYNSIEDIEENNEN